MYVNLQTLVSMGKEEFRQNISKMNWQVDIKKTEINTPVVLFIHVLKAVFPFPPQKEFIKLSRKKLTIFFCLDRTDGFCQHSKWYDEFLLYISKYIYIYYFFLFDLVLRVSGLDPSKWYDPHTYYYYCVVLVISLLLRSTSTIITNYYDLLRIVLLPPPPPPHHGGGDTIGWGRWDPAI